MSSNIARRSGTEERSVGELFGELANEMGTLVRQESRLATAELTEKAVYAGKQVAAISVGMLLGVVSLSVLVAALVMGLVTLIAPWAAALIVGVVVGVAATAAAMKGVYALKKMDPRPEETLASIKETKSWAYEQIR